MSPHKYTQVGSLMSTVVSSILSSEENAAS